jgi:hypothetical protein
MITLPTLPGPANGVAFGSTGNRLFYTPVVNNQKLNRNRTTLARRGGIRCCPALVALCQL